MQNNKLFLLFILFLLIPTQMQSRKGQNDDFVWRMNEDTDNELIEKIEEYNCTINWSTGKIRTEVYIPISDTDPNIGRQAANYSSQIKDLLRKSMIKALGYLRIDKMFLLKDVYSFEVDIRYEIIANVDKAFYYPPLKRGNRYYGAVELTLFGSGGLANLFYREIDNLKITNYVQKDSTKNMEYFDGLIVDTSIYKSYMPSIEIRIYDENTNLLYGPDTLNREDLEKNGVCQYTTSLKEAFMHPHSGRRIFYLMPHRLLGKKKTDIIIKNSDAARLFANPRTLKFLNQGRVIIVKPRLEDK